MTSTGTSIPSKSSLLYDRARRVLPGGVSRNAVLRKPHPLYAQKAEGCYITDVEGIRRIDFSNNMASLIHGHSHPAIVEAVTRQLHRGTAYNVATETEIVFAEHLCSRSKSCEMIRFVNSGTEAVMCCIKAARAHTGRPKIAKVEGAYHGIYDYAEISQMAEPANWGDETLPNAVPVVHGTPQGVLDDVIIIPFNDSERAVAILEDYADELACVIVDPLPHRVGLVPASQEFIATLRSWASANGALLVFDEVITFRSEFGGAQQWFDVQPDLTALGKIIGGGFPVGAVAGRAGVMEVFNPLADNVRFPHSGTFSGNPITMTAGLAAMQMFDRESVLRVNQLGGLLRRQIAEIIADSGVEACVTGAGSMFRIHFKCEPPENYRDSFATIEESARLKALLDHLFASGIILIGTGTGTLSTAMTSKEIDFFCEALASGFRNVQKLKAPQSVAATRREKAPRAALHRQSL